MTLEQLSYVSTIAKEGTISAAAEKLNVSHSAISRAIKSLEDELNFSIFERNRAGSKLTENGKCLLASTQIIFDEVKSIKNLSQTQNACTEISMSVFSIDSTPWLMDAIMNFRKNHTSIKLHISQDSVSSVFDKVLNCVVDIGIVLLPRHHILQIDPWLSHVKIADTPLVLLCSNNSPLSRKKSVKPHELAEYKFAIRDGSWFKDNFCKLFGSEYLPNVALTSNSTTVIRRAVAEGGVVATELASSIEQDDLFLAGKIVPVPLLINDSRYIIDCLFIHLKSKKLNIHEKLFLNHLKAACQLPEGSRG